MMWCLPFRFAPSTRTVNFIFNPLAVAMVLMVWLPGASAADLETWRHEFPLTDFTRSEVPLSEIRDDGNFRDTISPIDNPVFQSARALSAMGPLEPVLSVVVEGDARAYPLRMLLWHEIVNDTVGGVPLLISYCPLCNSGVVYDRRLNDRTLRFGNTGRIRHFDMVMYDHATESWWQQFTGEAIAGSRAGTLLKPVPARLESLALFRERFPEGQVLVPDDPMRQPYGQTPYFGMDRLWETQSKTMLRERYPYDLPENVSPLTRVVVVGEKAWSLDLIRRRERIEEQNIVLSWVPGQNSIHDHPIVASGRDVGNVVVQRVGEDGLAHEVVYDVTFAFAFRAFRPEGVISF